MFTPWPLTIPTTNYSRECRRFLSEERFHRSRPASEKSDSQPSATGTTVVADPAWHINMHDEVAMNTIQTTLAVLKEGGSLATKLPYIAPIAGLLLQALAMRDEVKQYKEECEIVMYKLARIARIIVNVGELCENHNLSKEDLPSGLRAILGSLQRTRELDRIEQVLKKCSKKKGFRGFLLRKDLLTKIKQCDVELSNVLHAFHAELSLDTRVALIAMRREVWGWNNERSNQSNVISKRSSRGSSVTFFFFIPSRLFKGLFSFLAERYIR